jgi:hypothetical protein
VRLSPEERAELRAFLRLRRLCTTKALCARFNVTARTLAREEAAMLDEPQCLNLGHTRTSRRVRVSINLTEEPTT